MTIVLRSRICDRSLHTRPGFGQQIVIFSLTAHGAPIVIVPAPKSYGAPTVIIVPAPKSYGAPIVIVPAPTYGAPTDSHPLSSAYIRRPTLILLPAPTYGGAQLSSSFQRLNMGGAQLSSSLQRLNMGRPTLIIFQPKPL